MKFRAKAAVSLLAAFSLLLCGCSKDDPALEGLNKTDISYIMKTSLTVVNGEELYYKTPFYVPSDILIRYEDPVCFDGRRLYFFRNSITDAETDAQKTEMGSAVAPRTAVISFYDTEKNEMNILLEEENKTHIRYIYAAFSDPYLYYYRLEAKDLNTAINGSADLYRISIDEKVPELIYSGQPAHTVCKGGVAASDGSIFLEKRMCDGIPQNSGDAYAYRLDPVSGKYEEFKADIYGLMKYRNGIAYIGGGRLFYFNLTDNTETEIYVPAEDEDIRFYSDGEKIFYQLFFSDERDRDFQTEIGYILDGKKVKIGDQLKNDDFFYDMRGEDLFLMSLAGGEHLVYDEKYGCLARISLNREYCTGFAAEGSVIFVCSDSSGQNPILYLYSREKPKTQLPSAANAQNDNFLIAP